MFLVSCHRGGRLSKEQRDYNRDIAFLHGIVQQVQLAFLEDYGQKYTNIEKAIHDLEAKHLFDYLKEIRTNQSLLFNPEVEKWRSAGLKGTPDPVQNELAIVFTKKYSYIVVTNDAFVGISFRGGIILTNALPRWPSVRLD